MARVFRRWLGTILALWLMAVAQLAWAVPPTVTSISPSSGSAAGGTIVTIIGTDFTGIPDVRFGATSASFVVGSSTNITATAPPGAAGTVDVTVTTADGTSAISAADRFTYVTLPTAGAVSATVAYGSTNNPITLNLTGGAATSVAVATGASHGTATPSGTTITYTPTAGYAGPDSFTYTATNGAGTSAPATVTVTVSAPTINYALPSPTAATAGVPYSQSLAMASGGAAPYTYTLASGALPSGISLASNGTLAGTATSAGTYNFTVRATDSSTGVGPFSKTSSPLTLSVLPPTLSMSPSTLPTPVVAIAYSQTMSTSGGTAPYSYAVTSGTLPSGLALSPSGVLAGTPTGGGAVAFSITATDTAGFSTTQSYVMTVGVPMVTMSPTAVPNGTVGAPYNQVLTAGGGTAPYTYAVTSGALPAGVTLSPAGLLSGTPTASGAFNVTVTATDSSTGGGPYTGSRPYTLIVGTPTLTLSPATLPTPTLGTAYSQTLTGAGGVAPYTFSISAGTLPPGLSLNASTGVLSGTPTTPGASTFTVKIMDSSTGVGAPFTTTRSFTLATAQTIPTAPPVAVTTASNGPVTIHAAANATGAPFSGVTITTPPASGSVVVNGLDIVYTPTPTTSGAVTFAYALNNSAGASAPVTVTVNVNAVPIAVAQRQLSTLANRPVSVDVTEGATGGPFTGVTIVSVTPANAGSATVAASAAKSPASADKQVAAAAGYTVTFTPAAAFSGAAVVTYTLSNAIATSSPAVLELSVAARRDPSTDPDVSGLINAQIQAARRFATAQLSNYNQRLEQLHGKGRAPSGNQITVQMPRTEGDTRRCESEQNLTARDACLRGVLPASRLADTGRRGGMDRGAGSREAAVAAEAGAGDGTGDGTGEGTAPDLPNAGAASTPDNDDIRLAFWTAGTVDFGFANTTAQRSGFRFTTGGVTAGADYRFSDEFTLGLGFGYGRDSTDVGASGTHSKADAFSVALYGSYRPKPSLFIDGVAGYGSLNFDSRRWVGDESAFAHGSRDGHQVFASVSTGYEYRDSAWLVSPYGRLSVSESTLDRYSETGAGFSSLTYFGQTVTAVSGTLGLRTEYAQPTRWGLFLPFARVEFQHDFNGQSGAGLAYADLAGAGPAYTVNGSPYGRDRVQVGLGAKLRTRSMRFGLDYNVMFGMGGLQQGVRLTLAAPF